jgi:hypothetical protein
MKYIFIPALLLLIIGNICAVDTESYEFIDHLLSITSPQNPDIFEDAVIFSASSQYKKVGIAFAHEQFSKVHWFRNLLVPREIVPLDENAKAPDDDGPSVGFADSGILFHIFDIPLDMSVISYRLVIDGLWTIDPYNPNKKMDLQTGLEYSIVDVPPIKRAENISQSESGSITFKYNASAGETVTVAGSFNSWDPYMYKMRETMPGTYSLTLSLPPGQHHYVFYHRGQRVLDPINNQKKYTREGLAASEIMIN